jgi:hypothetical protein
MTKKKRVLTKAQREEILKSLGKKPVEVRPQTNKKTLAPEVNISRVIDHTIILSDSKPIIKDLKRVLLASIIVIILLVTTVIVNHKTPYIQKVGEVTTKKLGF